MAQSIATRTGTQLGASTRHDIRSSESSTMCKTVNVLSVSAIVHLRSRHMAVSTKSITGNDVPVKTGHRMRPRSTDAKSAITGHDSGVASKRSDILWTPLALYANRYGPRAWRTEPDKRQEAPPRLTKSKLDNRRRPPIKTVCFDHLSRDRHNRPVGYLRRVHKRANRSCVPPRGVVRRCHCHGSTGQNDCPVTTNPTL